MVHSGEFEKLPLNDTVVALFKSPRICRRGCGSFLLPFTTSVTHTRLSLFSSIVMAFRSSVALAALSARALARKYLDD